MLSEVPQKFDLVQIEAEVSSIWVKKKIMERSFEINKGKENFSFLEGPPTANGPPHIGHAETRAMKDLFLRYKTMKGYNIYPRIAGWDCHGLPVEIEVEKTLKIKNKKEIDEMGIGNFNRLCKESVFKYVKDWERVSKKLGYWVDYDNAYVTMKDEYIESVWWALKELYKKGLLFKDFRISPFCPRCGTTLSAHEVAQGYRDIEDFSIYVKFKIKGRDEYFLVWTTTPWTLPANTFLAVNPDFNYVLVNVGGEKYWLVEDRVKEVLRDFEIIEKKQGKEFKGMEYEQLLPFLQLKKGLYVVEADFVTKEDGTGIVHIAPAFGADDYKILKRENGELYVTVAEDGKINLESPWKGMQISDANDEILKYLKVNGRMLKKEKAVHSYPFCWRCGTRLIYYPVESWFIGVSRRTEDIVSFNKRINWKPEYIRDGRFGNFLEEGKDWAISRNRYWGTPLPVWTCSNGHTFVAGSKRELLENAAEVPKNFELHKPYVDDIRVKCNECGSFMKREPYPIDTWFDSGSAFYAQYHYPFENKELFEKNFPVDFITEAMDQTRGWFYVLHVISSMLFGSNSYSNVIVMEFVLNSKGEKMSKSKGDVVDPMKIIEKIGTDALRLFFYQGPPWKTKRFSEEIADEYARKVLGTLYNSYMLFSTNARLDKWNPRKENMIDNLDKWLYYRTNLTITNVNKYMDSYEPHRALEEIEALVMDLSQWYLRLSRDKFWNENITDEKRSSYFVTHYAILETVKMLAPFTPYFSDFLYTKMTGEDSVHLSSFPVAGETEDLLLREMDKVKLIVETGRRIRQINSLTLRRPVKQVVIGDMTLEGVAEKYRSLISKELNTKDVVIADIENYMTRNYRLNRKIAGKEFGKDLAKAEEEFSKEENQKLFETNKGVTIMGRGISESMVLVEKHLKEGYVTDPEGRVPILINKESDRGLLLEGLAREIVRRIQSMRKDAGFDYTDKIRLKIDGDQDLIAAFDSNKKYILDSTQAVQSTEDSGFNKEWEISEMKLIITISKI
ncbi:MAG: isoleucine--tRNA ligase [Candidatus Thermoplasmatota archaeon]|nr:isoleucine--tRNA ligase [Candidatus Thermoplasmatota archaeon]MCL5680849.1 isoleucine--tRNA ligase [Candidatus Thermoplasmatota archaeon]